MRVAVQIAAVVLAVLAAACTGPQLHVVNPDAHAVFVDGRAVAAPAPPPLGSPAVASTAVGQPAVGTTLPFRYYGTTSVDALPADGPRDPRWDVRPARQLVAIEPPASPWLFPLDFPLELLARAVAGRDDRTVVITLPAADDVVHGDPEAAEAAADARAAALAERAHAARTAR